MQTFLPFESYMHSAMVLDRQRLGNQRRETLQIMTALLEGRGWVNHPATNMWRGYEFALMLYQEAICEEWVARGYRDNCLDSTTYIFFKHSEPDENRRPPWLGFPEFHWSHRSNLVRKNPEYYRPQFPDVPDDLPYYWPV